MNIGFFFVLRQDPTHYLHACALARECAALMPEATVVHLTDARTPAVPGAVTLRCDSTADLLEQRLTHYASLKDSWLLLDTDVVPTSASVARVFDDDQFDVALTDRHWPHLPQGDALLQAMPFNTGVVFSRCAEFWSQVREVWRAWPVEARTDWMSEQRAVWEVVKTGRFHIKILPGMAYNYPPTSATDRPDGAWLVHYKGNRKAWRSLAAYRTLAA